MHESEKMTQFCYLGQQVNNEGKKKTIDSKFKLKTFKKMSYQIIQ